MAVKIILWYGVTTTLGTTAPVVKGRSTRKVENHWSRWTWILTDHPWWILLVGKQNRFWTWWCSPLTPALGKRKQADSCDSEPSLGCTVSSRPAKAAQWQPVSKQNIAKLKSLQSLHGSCTFNLLIGAYPNLWVKFFKKSRSHMIFNKFVVILSFDDSSVREWCEC